MFDQNGISVVCYLWSLSVVFICGQSFKYNLASCAYVRVRTFALRVHKSVHGSEKKYSSTKSMRATAFRGRILMNKQGRIHDLLRRGRLGRGMLKYKLSYS